ncbi:UNVERIFIED_CONTAM: hypothetical protein Sradi_1912800 [Sesamum radiatum]|uniref:Uncharacterized protein n=1 Tax=Sesamum radiatum TaxID=300843 RepID=A0AAW2TYY2_SESRA
MRVPDRHIRYAVFKSIFWDQDDRRVVCTKSWGHDAILVEKLEDLKAGLNNDTYIDVILQSLPSSYDPFIVNYNMNGLEKSIHELINMLVQYEATTRKSEPSVLVGEASTSKGKARVARRWKRRRVRNGGHSHCQHRGCSSYCPEGKGQRKGRGFLAVEGK